jgi:NADH-quinone oxidoreductase subunit N
MRDKLINSVVYLDSFTLFPEYFLGLSGIYILIVITLITYNVYGLMLQKAISESLGLMLFMASYLLINDDIINVGFSNFNGSILNDSLAYYSKLIVCISSAFYFLIISNFLKYYRLTSFEYLLITLFAIIGLILLCGSNDLLTAYLAIELFSLASYLLASFKKTSTYSIDSGLKYFVTGALSSAFFLLGSSFLYGQLGSINFDVIKLLTDTKYSDKFPLDWVDWPPKDNPEWFNIALRHILWYLFSHFTMFSSSLVDLGLALILFSLFIKLGIAPFHLWSLDVYEGSPTSATFFFAVITKLSIFVLIIRLCYHTLPTFRESWIFYSLILSVISIFVGSFGGLQTRKLKTLFAYSSTSHMGYALLAFTSSIGAKFAVEIIFFYLVIYIIAGLATWFIILSLILKTKKFPNKFNKELGDLASLHKANPGLAVAFATTMFSIAGMPPLIGFLAKLGVFLSIVSSGQELNYYEPIIRRYLTSYNHEYYFVAVITILCSVVSTFYYIRIVKILFFENTLVGKLYHPINNQKVLILSFLVFLLIFLFFIPNPNS